MKLIVAIVHDEDSNKLIQSLGENNIGVTKLASTGGFLKAGNTTILVGVQKEKVDHVLKIIEENCTTRKEITTTANMISEAGGFMTMPLEITVGGATVFVLDVDKYVKY